jgi:hypothetical protein
MELYIIPIIVVKSKLITLKMLTTQLQILQPPVVKQSILYIDSNKNGIDIKNAIMKPNNPTVPNIYAANIMLMKAVNRRTIVYK